MTQSMQTFNSALLSVAYLPPVQYMTKFLIYDRVIVEMHENFQKQSYRNRCVISGANGPLTLVIPIKKKQGAKTVITDIRIDYDKGWQHIHWKSLVSAYQNSPFFEFYRDELYKLIFSKNEFLADYNLSLLDHICSLLNLDKTYLLSREYANNTELHDYRQSINPKNRLRKPDTHFQPVIYPQVFAEKFGFIPNLSVADLIFNEGPDSRFILEESIKKGH
jgi:hypothetical protein